MNEPIEDIGMVTSPCHHITAATAAKHTCAHVLYKTSEKIRVSESIAPRCRDLTAVLLILYFLWRLAVTIDSQSMSVFS